MAKITIKRRNESERADGRAALYAANLKKEVAAISKEGSIEHSLKQQLHSGQRISKADLKGLIQQVYNSQGVKKTAKATDITKFGFDTKEVKIKIRDKYINGVELYER